MFGPQIEREFQINEFNRQQLLRQAERDRLIAQTSRVNSETVSVDAVGEPRRLKEWVTRLSIGKPSLGRSAAH